MSATQSRLGVVAVNSLATRSSKIGGSTRGPLGHTLEAQDVAAYVAFLASEAAWGVTGAAATVDLGWTAH